MDAGALLIVLATLAAIGATLARGLGLGRDGERFRALGVWLSVLTFALVSAVLLMLVYYFMVSNMDYFYVWSNSSSDLSGVYKLSGVWAGAEGSFLLWIWFMSLVLVFEVLLEPRRSYLSAKFHGIFQATLTGIISIFLLLLLNMNLFGRTASWLLTQWPNGYGMKLMLQTPEMVVHPPVVFAGYAFCIAAFAAAASFVLSEDRNWYRISLPWTRLGWIFLTLGIGIGAIWAYYVLGWGGYWAWDPVETASLLPWLVATAFLHTLLRHSKKGEYQLWAPALGMLSFVAVVFATFATRAGSIWSSSVHNFGSSVGTSGGARLSYLLQNDSTVLGIFSLLVLLFVAAVALGYLRYSRMPRSEEQPEPEKISEYISDRNNMMLTVVLLSVTSAIMLLLMFKNVNASQTANFIEFNQKLSIFFVGLMATMSVCLVWKFVGKELALYVGSGLIVASIALAVLVSVTGWLDALVAFSLPAYGVAVAFSVLRLARSRVVGSIRKTLQRSSPHLIHLGVALVLLSFVVSNNMQSLPRGLNAGTTSVEMALGDTAKVGGYTVKLVALNANDESSGSGATSANAVREMTMDIMQSGHQLRSGVVLTDLYMITVVDGKPSAHVVNVEVFVYKSWADDLYLDFQWLSNTTASVQMKVVPMMNFLWAGFGLLVIGLAVRTLAWRDELPEEEPRSTPKDKSPEPQPAANKDYESLIEEELRKFKETRGR